MPTRKLLAAFAVVDLLSAALALPAAQSDDEKPKQKRHQYHKLKNPAAEDAALTRKRAGDFACSRRYKLRLNTFALVLNAYVHTPAKVAA